MSDGLQFELDDDELSAQLEAALAELDAEDEAAQKAADEASTALDGTAAKAGAKAAGAKAADGLFGEGAEAADGLFGEGTAKGAKAANDLFSEDALAKDFLFDGDAEEDAAGSQFDGGDTSEYDDLDPDDLDSQLAKALAAAEGEATLDDDLTAAMETSRAEAEELPEAEPLYEPEAEPWPATEPVYEAEPEEEAPEEETPEEEAPEEEAPKAEAPEEEAPEAAAPEEEMPEAETPEESQAASMDVMDFDTDAFIDEESLLDYELAEALEKDRKSDESVVLEEQAEDFVRDISVYSGDDDYERTEKLTMAQKLGQRIDAIPKRFLVATLSVMGVLTAVMIGLGATAIMRYTALRAELTSRGEIVRQGESTANNAGFIYLESALPLADGEAKLVKMNLSRAATVLYFDRYIDMRRYDAVLTDEMGRSYSVNRTYYENVESAAGEMRMWFGPLAIGADSFTLTVYDLEGGDSVSRKYSAGQVLAQDAVRYTKEPLALDCDSDTVTAQITSAIFSAAGSQISYAINWENADERVVLAKPGVDEYFTLSDSGRLLPRDSYSFGPYEFADERTLIGRLDFSPVRSLDGTVSIEFDNMYKQLRVDREVCLADIFYTKLSPELRMDVGPYELVLERGGVQVNQYVLVMHVNDRRLEDVTDMSKRVQAYADVVMVARKPDGSTVELNPRLIRDAPEGTDIVFDGSEAHEFLFGMPIEQIFFRIDSINARLPKTTVELNLARAERKLALTAESALESVAFAFERRLGYKTGNVGYNEVDRFDMSIMNDRELMQNYTPVFTPAQTSVDISAWSLKDDRFVAVLHETWRSDEEYMHLVHEVVAEYGNRGWIITKDRLRQS